MLKKISTLLVLFGGLMLAQTTDLEKEKIKSNPKIVEESFIKANVKANIIEGYNQQYHIRTSFNKKGFITQRESYAESGELNYTETYFYDENNRLIKVETTHPTETFTIIKDYEYTENGYTETQSEDGIVVMETAYILNNQKQIVSEKETNFLEENLVTDRLNEYTNHLLTKTEVRYKNGGYTVKYKYNADKLPTEEIIYDLKNKLVSKKIRAYDHNNNIVEENLFDQYGKLKTNHRIKYEYDEKGNWTTRTQYANTIEEPISNAKRTIRY